MFLSFINIGYFPSLLPIRIQKYICSMQHSLTPQGEFLAPSPTHPQKCVNIARTQLAPLYSNLFVSLFPQSHCTISSWGKGSCLAKTSVQFSVLILLDLLEAFLMVYTLLPETLSLLLGYHILLVFIPLLANLSPSPLLLSPSLSLPLYIGILQCSVSQSPSLFMLMPWLTVSSLMALNMIYTLMTPKCISLPHTKKKPWPRLIYSTVHLDI